MSHRYQITTTRATRLVNRKITDWMIASDAAVGHGCWFMRLGQQVDDGHTLLVEQPVGRLATWDRDLPNVSRYLDPGMAVDLHELVDATERLSHERQMAGWEDGALGAYRLTGCF